VCAIVRARDVMSSYTRVFYGDVGSTGVPVADGFCLLMFGLCGLRNCAISRKVANSIPAEFTGFFNWPNPSNHPGVDLASDRN
jgi:hypothetical protein